MPSTNPIYRDPRWRRARKQALIAAGFKCRRCGAPLDKRNTNVHHHYPALSHPQLAFVGANLVALCTRCHGAIERMPTTLRACDVEGNPTAHNHPWKLYGGGGSKPKVGVPKTLRGKFFPHWYTRSDCT
jgi:HNH endonuclease